LIVKASFTLFFFFPKTSWPHADFISEPNLELWVTKSRPKY